MTDNEQASGMSAAERTIRRMLKRIVKQRDYEPFTVSVGEMRTLMKDLETWRRIAQAELDFMNRPGAKKPPAEGTAGGKD